MFKKIWTLPHDSGGQLTCVEHDSKILRQPSAYVVPPVRRHYVFEVAKSSPGQTLGVYILPPWLSNAQSLFQWEPFREGLMDRLARLVRTHTIPPATFIVPDLYCEFGGTQFIDSTAVGRHASTLVQEVFPGMEQLFDIQAGPLKRAVLGRSSGGFGALRLAMDFDNVCGAVACHAGDMGFEWVYRRSLIDLCTAMVRYQSPRDYMSYLQRQNKLSSFDLHNLMMLGMAAFYSPNPQSDLGYDLPIHLKTGELYEDVFAQWLSHDPVVRVDNALVCDRLGQLKSLFIDCGQKDQYFLQYGSRQLTAKLKAKGIAHDYQEFDDNHSGTTYRFDVSLQKILAAIS